MSYEVVARRWRPLTFGSVVGQSHVTQTLANAIRRDRVPHAFLLTGTRGVGKTTIARLLARAINCTNRGENAEPCNQCPSCLQNLSGSSMDIIEIDGASNNGVDEVRDLIESAQYRPSSGRFKVYIIDEVHQLSKSAFNALLKTLEEPPSHVKFIMATTEVHKLPPTVLSRCQRYDFKRLSDDEIGRQLTTIAERDGMQISPDAIALLAREADGSMRDAQSLLEQAMAGADGPLGVAEVAQLLGVAGTELVSGIVESIVLGDAPRIVDLIGEVRRYGYDIERLLGEVLEILRHVTVATVANVKALSPVIPENHRRLATELRAKRSPLDLQRIFSSLLGTASDLRRGTHPDLVLEMGLLKVASLESVESAAELLSKLGAMESGSAPRSAAAPRTMSGPAPTPQRIEPQRTEPARTEAPRSQPQTAAPQRPAQSPPQAPPPPRTAAPAADRLPLAGKPNAAAVEAWTGPEGEPLEPLSEEEALARRWEAFLDDIKKKGGLDLYVTVTNCKLASITPEHVQIAPISASWAQKLKNPTVLGRVTEVARAHFGENVSVKIVDASAQAEGVTLQGIHDERTAKKKASALADPFVDKAVADLGGRVTKVSVYEE
ncbi:MAG TPA: DNA polymerase III subunit gamma/tau [Candidatus Limnocylindrales bacterium]|nr:DNA polymerase III subunit gamma/tau [Candidatus Limnocylindrales bacterium]